MKEEAEVVKEMHWTKDYAFRGFGFRRAHMVTDEADIINGISIIFMGRPVFTIAHANTLWVDDNDKPHGVKLEGSSLFVYKFVIDFAP